MRSIIVLHGGLDERVKFINHSKKFNIFNVKPQFDNGERFDIRDFDLFSYYSGILSVCLQKAKDKEFIIIEDVDLEVVEKIRETFELPIYSVLLSSEHSTFVSTKHDTTISVGDNFENNLEKLFSILQ